MFFLIGAMECFRIDNHEKNKFQTKDKCGQDLSKRYENR